MQFHLLARPDILRLLLSNITIDTNRSALLVRELKSLIDKALHCG